MGKVLSQAQEKITGNDILLNSLRELLKIDPEERVTLANLQVAIPNYEIIKKEISSIRKRAEARLPSSFVRRESYYPSE